MKPFEILDEKTVHRTKIFNVNQVVLTNPYRNSKAEFVRIDSPDWVNIIAVTTEGSILLIRQYRVGLDEICLEIPGGMVDTGESPEAAARRELLEETGYVPKRMESLGWVSPNPAFLNNRLHLFVAHECSLEAAPSFDTDEYVEVLVCTRSEVSRLLQGGDIHHALVVAAFGRFFSAFANENSVP